METKTTDPFDLARAQAMIIGYDARWSEERYEVLAVEAEYRAPLLNPETGAASRTWQRGGKLDAILREPSGRIVFMEHKTSSEDISPGSSYWRKLHMDGQVSGYFLGSETLGFPAEACIYDVLGKPEQRPATIPLLDEAGSKIVLGPTGERVRTKDGKKWRESADSAAGHVLQTRPETPEEFRARVAEAIANEPTAYYQRGEVVRLEAEMAEALYDDWQTAKMLREAELAQRFPRNPDACFKWGRACDFWDVCTGAASLEDAHRFRRSEHVNPELEARGGLPVLSASRLHAARACQRLHKLKYLDGYRAAVEADTLRLGSLIHRGLEAWWRAPAGERIEAALAALTTTTKENHDGPAQHAA
jgi:hypothetical protein